MFSAVNKRVVYTDRLRIIMLNLNFGYSSSSTSRLVAAAAERTNDKRAADDHQTLSEHAWNNKQLRIQRRLNSLQTPTLAIACSGLRSSE